MDLLQILSKFYYEMSLDELKLMNENDLYPGISYNSLLYMDLIAYNDNCTVSELAQKLHISKPAVTMKVNELIKQGLVEKKQSDIDKRVFYLSVTPEIRKDYRKYSSRMLYTVKKLSREYAQEELSLFCSMLESLKEGYLEGEDINEQ